MHNLTFIVIIQKTSSKLSDHYLTGTVITDKSPNKHIKILEHYKSPNKHIKVLGHYKSYKKHIRVLGHYKSLNTHIKTVKLQ